MKIINIGSLNIDYVYEVDSFVKKGETKLSNKLNIYSGGKGLNQSIALKRAGAEVYHGGLIGKDGSFLKELLEKEKVNTDFISIVNSPSGHAIIQVDESGDNCILLHGGANQLFTEEIVDSILENFNKGDYLLLQNEINLMEYIINKASEKGLIIVLNPSPINSKLKSYPLDKVDIFILNEVEGKELTNKEKEEDILNELISKYLKAQFVLTLGEKGVRYGFKDERIEVNAKQVKAMDTTAAGDTFTGYYLASMLSGKSVQEALETATVASSITVTREGAADSIPYMKEILE
ncbi:ribokinase [Clostridium amylolyticum]|uniref:Ribokinase n=1 Tax=Clostridium amylolyticum TaxID=1121298 RepID=A0A1M6LUY3_9CLOT|nr:ribokinase [Clostridium amylolyticum]SHJ74912.1 ribokinase [Clostridium amylolyticum]